MEANVKLSREQAEKLESYLDELDENLVRLRRFVASIINPEPPELGLDQIHWYAKGKPATSFDEYAYTYLRYKGLEQVRPENEPLLRVIEDSYNGEVEAGQFIYFLSADGAMLRRRLKG